MSGPRYSEFSAGDSMLGYIYQCEYALYHILDRDNLATSLAIETSDDLVLEGHNGDPQQLLQLKLHGATPNAGVRNLTDRHEDIWKTLRNWATQVQRSDIDPATTSFVLMTTASRVTTETSIAHALCPKHSDGTRQPNEALSMIGNLALEIIADTKLSDKSSLKKGASAFLALPVNQRISLVRNMTIVTSNPSIRELRKKIDSRLRASGASEEAHPDFVETIVGWWYGACINHLSTGGIHPIKFEALERKIAETAQRFNISSLPRYQIVDALNEDQIRALNERTFVKQILETGYKQSGTLVVAAMLDFYKADAHRKRWLEELLIDNADLRQFEAELRAIWQIHFGFSEADCADIAEDEDLERLHRKAGQRTIRDTLAAPPPELKKFSEGFFARGSYHILANGSPPTIGWHPLWHRRFLVTDETL